MYNAVEVNPALLENESSASNLCNHYERRHSYARIKKVLVFFAAFKKRFEMKTDFRQMRLQFCSFTTMKKTSFPFCTALESIILYEQTYKSNISAFDKIAIDKLPLS